ncbi:MAG: hypothetical protein ACI4XC_07395 [Eubacterium sp.]
MKKILLVVLSLIICICFAACFNNNAQTDNTNESVVSEIPTTKNETTAERETSTTKPATENSKKAKDLENKVLKAVKIDGKVTVDNIGGFKFKANKLDTEEMYSMEASEELAKLAEDNAKAFVENIGEFYSDEIKYESTGISQYGSGDNGIDSATYVITYINSQYQELEIRADSTGEIYYVSCSFTW